MTILQLCFRMSKSDIDQIKDLKLSEHCVSLNINENFNERNSNKLHIDDASFCLSWYFQEMQLP